MIDRTLSVGQLARDLPGAPAVFEELGIDYCCGGAKTLADACAGAGASVDDVVAKLEKGKAQGAPADERWAQGPIMELVDFIVSTHHEFTRRELERLHGLMVKVRRVHGDAHPELAEIARLFFELEDDLGPHLLKEEQVLFPMIRDGFGPVDGPVEMMWEEHDEVGDLLRDLRAATHEYTAPSDGCGSYHALFDGLRALEADIHRHIHLENNILFPRIGVSR